MAEFWDRVMKQWLGPSAVLITIGFIIWLVQVNQWGLDHERRIGVIEEENQRFEAMIDLAIQNQSRLVAIQESHRYRLEDLDDSIDRLEGRVYDNKGGGGK